MGICFSSALAARAQGGRITGQLGPLARSASVRRDSVGQGSGRDFRGPHNKTPPDLFGNLHDLTDRLILESVIDEGSDSLASHKRLGT